MQFTVSDEKDIANSDDIKQLGITRDIELSKMAQFVCEGVVDPGYDSEPSVVNIELQKTCNRKRSAAIS